MTKDYLMVVNKANNLNPEQLQDFKMEEVAVLDGDQGKNTGFVEEETHKAFLNLQKDVKEKLGLNIQINSAGRTVEDQQFAETQFYNRQLEKGLSEAEAKEKTEDCVAKPGQSEHHTGLAIDYEIVPKSIIDKIKIRFLKPSMRKKVNALLAEHGFILRYQEAFTDYTGVKRPEDWHIRFVGSKEVAKEIEASGKSLEEFLGMEKIINNSQTIS